MPNFGFETRFDNYSNRNNFNSRNGPHPNSNQRNHDGFNYNRNNPSDHHFPPNQFNKRYDNNSDNRKEYGYQTMNNQNFNNDQNFHSKRYPYETKEQSESNIFPVERNCSSEQKLKPQFERENDNEKLSNIDTKPNLTDVKKEVFEFQSKSRAVEDSESKNTLKSNTVNVKTEPKESKVKSQPISKSAVKSNSGKVKTEPDDPVVKSEPLDNSSSQDHESEDLKPHQPLRASRRTKKVVKPLIENSENDSEEEVVDIKPMRKTRKRKVESSDDEYVPDDPPSSKKLAKVEKPVKVVKSKTVSEPKEKPPRKPRVTKKMKLEENIDESSSNNIDLKDAAKPKKATAKKATVKKATPKKATKRTVKTKINASLSGEEEILVSEEEKPTKKKVAAKRKLKTSGDNEEEEGSKDTAKKPRKEITFNNTYWTDEGLLAEMCSCEKYVAWNFIKLINSDNTIPFIARYRKEMVQNYEAEKLREMKQAYENIVEIHQKAETIIGKIEKLKKMTPELKKSILCCKSLEELDLIYSPYKVGSKGTKAEKAKKLGLETPALSVLNGDFDGNLSRFVDASKAELNNEAKVTDGIQHIIADVIAKDTAVLETLQNLVKSTRILFESTKAKQAETIENFDKYETYFSYSCDIKFVKPHAVLAINRGEAHKVLSVNVKLNDWLQNKLYEFCKRKWLSQGSFTPSRSHLFQISFEDSFKRLIKPFIVRSIRTQLNQAAEIASIQVFASNLKQLLLVPPMHGAVIMAIDPGYSHGCKVAVIDTNGNVLVTDTLYIKFNKNKNPSGGKDINALKLRDMVLRHRCELVAIGNGTACRETETYMSELIQSNWFEPLNVCYTIISEQGKLSFQFPVTLNYQEVKGFFR